jgi:hypothetical protein
MSDTENHNSQFKIQVSSGQVTLESTLAFQQEAQKE